MIWNKKKFLLLIMFIGEIDIPEKFCLESEESMYKTHRKIKFYCSLIFFTMF